MSGYLWLICICVLWSKTAAYLTIPPSVLRTVAISVPSISSYHEEGNAGSTGAPTLSSAPTATSVSFSELVTMAPLSRNPLELRQRCFDDQGFSVNCATWTGYFYTWGGSGHPYAGGPGGEGGGQSSSGGVNVNGASDRGFPSNRLGAALISCLVAHTMMFFLWIM